MEWLHAENPPSEDICDVIGFNESWIDEDFNPHGIRICTHFDGGWTCAKWNAIHDCYISMNSDDDPDAIPEKWCHAPVYSYPPRPDCREPGPGKGKNLKT